MKRLASLAAATLMACSCLAMAGTVQELELDPNRTSIEYRSEIESAIEALSKHKWVQADEDYNGITLAAEAKPEFNWKESYTENGIFARVHRYSFNTSMRDYLVIGRQSRWDGYVEFYSFDNPTDALHFKVINDKTLHVRFEHLGEKDYTFLAVDEFKKVKVKLRDHSDIIF